MAEFFSIDLGVQGKAPVECFSNSGEILFNNSFDDSGDFWSVVTGGTGSTTFSPGAFNAFSTFTNFSFILRQNIFSEIGETYVITIKAKDNNPGTSSFALGFNFGGNTVTTLLTSLDLSGPDYSAEKSFTITSSAIEDFELTGLLSLTASNSISVTEVSVIKQSQTGADERVASDGWNIEIEPIPQAFYGYGYGNYFIHSSEIETNTTIDFFNILGLDGNQTGFGIDNRKFNNLIQDNNFEDPFFGSLLVFFSDHWNQLITNPFPGINRSNVGFEGFKLSDGDVKLTQSTFSLPVNLGSKYQFSFFVDDSESTGSGWFFDYEVLGNSYSGLSSAGLHSRIITATDTFLTIDFSTSAGGGPITLKDIELVEIIEDEFAYSWGYEYANIVNKNCDEIMLKATITNNGVAQENIRVVFHGNPFIRMRPSYAITDSNGEAFTTACIIKDDFNTILTNEQSFVDLPTSGFFKISAEIDRQPEDDESKVVIETFVNQFEFEDAVRFFSQTIGTYGYGTFSLKTYGY